MTQKFPLRSPFAGIDFASENQHNSDSGQIINFSNEAPNFPVEPPSKINFPSKQPKPAPIPKNFAFPNGNQELSGNISLIGGYSMSNPKGNLDALDELPLLEGKI